jgi:hypothetical protein
MDDKHKHKLIGAFIASIILGTPQAYMAYEAQVLKTCREAYFIQFNEELPFTENLFHRFQTYPLKMKEVPECKTAYSNWWADFERSHQDRK